MSKDFVFRGRVADLDPDLHEILIREKERQERTIILIPSESMAPDAVEEAMGSKFGNVYAEGYPRESSRRQTEREILDIEVELAIYRRNSDPRYYKGVEYADILEALARRRAADLFAANGVSPDELYVNVQPLSGGPANSALYTAILNPGDTIMGLKLSDGGHLSHGAPVNRSGSVYRSVSYTVDPDSERLDYDAIEQMALREKPQCLVAGFSAYPLQVDWQRFREIADKVGAHFHADIAHISGLVAAGVHPSPIGIADSVMTTTHKSLCGPRGAMLMTHRRDIGEKIDKAVFPGEQGGGHFNTIGALAVALKLAQTPQFAELQKRIVQNAARLAAKLTEHGLRIVAGGTETHLLLIDCATIKSSAGVALDGDSAARLLDMAGIVVNKNTIPGDRSALAPSGIRLGTVWISQRGFAEREIDRLAEAIAILLREAVPHEYAGSVRRRTTRARVPAAVLARAREIVEELTRQVPVRPDAEDHTLRIRGADAMTFMNGAVRQEILDMVDGETRVVCLRAGEEELTASLHRGTAEKAYLRFATPAQAARARGWLQDLSDGYILIGDPYAKLPGPVTIENRYNIDLSPPDSKEGQEAAAVENRKPFFVGGDDRPAGHLPPLPAFEWTESKNGDLKRTRLYDVHVAAGARMVDFGGYEMPVWYSSVSEEHAAVRQASALFDVSHMGIFSADGPGAFHFLDAVTTNDLSMLAVGRSQYTYLLAPDGAVIDDLMIYRMGPEDFMLVVNAANIEKDWAWLQAVNRREVCIDPARPWAAVSMSCELRDVRAAGERVLIALQGPQSIDVLEKIGGPAAALKKMGWASQKSMTVGDYDLIVSRSGYTGERVGFELFVHPDRVAALWEALVQAGAVQAGLACRDSTRTEAGLPLYGHELAGPLAIDPDTACFGLYVKLWKPFFIGREAYIERYENHPQTIVRFQMEEKGVRRPVQGDPIIDRRGKVVGFVTSCAIDSDGLLTGMALVPQEYKKKGTQLQIYQLDGGARPLKGAETVAMGTRLPRPDTAIVLNRFPSAN